MITIWAGISFGILLTAEIVTFGYDLWEASHGREFDASLLWILWLIGLSFVSAVSMSPLFPYFFFLLAIFVLNKWWRNKLDQLCEEIRKTPLD